MPFRKLALIAVISLRAAVPVSAQSVDAERIRHADREPGAWLSYGRTYDEQRYSPLSQIDADNVSELGLVWTYDTGRDRGHEATPLVANGTLYLTTSWSGVHAVDLETGEAKWSYNPDVPREWGYNACCDVVNRGAALWDGHVFVGTLDGRLVKLDAETGEVIWDENTIDRNKPYTITGAPRIVKGKVIIGNGGAEYGVRGYVSAYDADTGDLAWRFYTVPGDPSKPFEHPELEMAAETWTGEWWKIGGGGTVWDAIAYDPDLDLLYVGTGNGSPWARKLRSPDGGDNLFLCSILALDPDDGRLVWHYQTTPADNWDYTSVQHIMLADLEIAGEPRRVVMQAPKNGFFYVLDAETGELISAEKYTRVTWASHVDLETGRPVETEQANFDLEPKVVFPGPGGGHNWQPMAFSPKTGLVYIPARDAGLVYNLDRDFEYDPKLWNLGVHWEDPRVRALMASMPPPTGALTAWDPVEQQPAWSVPLDAVNNGGLLATAGDLLFQGEPSGRFSAYSATTGERLWSVETGIGIVAAPITYELGGEQYVSVLAGWGGSVPAADLATAAAVTNTNPGRLFTFKLGGKSEMPEVPKRYQTLHPLPERFGTEAEVARGLDLYDTHCGRCHGYGGNSSGLNSDLRYSRPAVHENFESIVRDGRFVERGMPSFEEILSPRDVRAIHAFVVDVAQSRPDPSADRDAAEIPAMGLGRLSLAESAEHLASQRLEFQTGPRRLGEPSLQAERGGRIVELYGEPTLERITVSWAGTTRQLEASFDSMPELIAPFVPWVGEPFFDALERDGHMTATLDGVVVRGEVRSGGALRMWFFEAFVQPE